MRQAAGTLFLLSAAGAFWHFHRGSAATTGLWGLVAGLTRPNGFLLSGALVVTAALDERRARPAEERHWDRYIAVAMPVVGMLAYSAFVYNLSGNPFAWAETQQAWGNRLDPTGFIVHRWNTIRASGLSGWLSASPLDPVAVAAVLLALLSLPTIVSRFSWGLATFVALYLAPPLLVDAPPASCWMARFAA